MNVTQYASRRRSRSFSALVIALMSLLVLTGVTTGLISRPIVAQAENAVQKCQADKGIYLYITYHQKVIAQGCTHGKTAAARINEISTVKKLASGWICQIGGLPEKCEIPTSNTWVYWTFWWAHGGSHWIYADEGSGYKGKPGTVELWNYGHGIEEPPQMAAPPLYTPPAAPPAQPAPPVNNGGSNSGGSGSAGGSHSGSGSTKPREQSGKSQGTKTAPQPSQAAPSAQTTEAGVNDPAAPSALATADPSAAVPETTESSTAEASEQPSALESLDPATVTNSSSSKSPLAVIIVTSLALVTAIGYGIYRTISARRHDV